MNPGERFMKRVYLRIAHGDAQHQQWLEKECKNLASDLNAMIDINWLPCIVPGCNTWVSHREDEVCTKHTNCCFKCGKLPDERHDH